MARSLNKVTLIGNVGGDPDVRSTASGVRVAKVSLATSRSFQDRSGQQQERTEWHRLTFWDRLADIVEQYVGKGDRLYVEGQLEYSQTQDDRGGTRYWTDIRVRDMIMLGSRGGRDGGDGYGGSGDGASQGWQQESEAGAPPRHPRVGHGHVNQGWRQEPEPQPQAAAPSGAVDAPQSESGGAEPEDDLPF